MWNNLVSISSVFASEAIYRFFEVYWHHPIIGTAFMAVFFVLAVLFWIETAKETLGRRDPLDNGRPMQLRR